MKTYDLMHCNIPVLTCSFWNGRINDVLKLYDVEHVPVGCVTYFGKPDVRRLACWWDDRMIPVKRQNIKAFADYDIRGAILLEKNFGCSLSDCYWMRPEGSDVKWEDVNYYREPFISDQNDLFLGGRGEAPIGSPSFFTSGNMPKAWTIEPDGTRVLHKAALSQFGQEIYNEIIASQICQIKQIPHVHYTYEEYHGIPCCKCACVCDDTHEFVSAYDIILAIRKAGKEDVAVYMDFVREQGLDIDKAISDQVCMDYLVANTDRYWCNFGLVRNAETLKYERIMPMFDFGDSLFYASSQIPKHDRRYDRRTSPFSGVRLDQDLRKYYKDDYEKVNFAEIVDKAIPAHIMPAERRDALLSWAKWREDYLFTLCGKS